MPGGLYSIQDRGFQQAFERRLLIRDDVGFTLSPEIAGVLPVDAPELRYALGWKRWMAGNTVAAVAAVSAQMQLRNPDASNIIIQIESISVDSLATPLQLQATNLTVGPGIADLATTQRGAMRDTRQFSAAGSASAGIVSWGTAAPIVIAMVNVLGPTNTEIYMPGLPIFLFPGTAFKWDVGQLNQAVNFTVVWSERVLNDQENVP